MTKRFVVQENWGERGDAENQEQQGQRKGQGGRSGGGRQPPVLPVRSSPSAQSTSTGSRNKFKTRPYD